jgi:hypothetical protein
LDSLREAYSAPDAIPMFRDRVVLIPCTETAAARSNFFDLLQQPNVIITSCNNKAAVYRQPGYDHRTSLKEFRCFFLLAKIKNNLQLKIIYMILE